MGDLAEELKCALQTLLIPRRIVSMVTHPLLHGFVFLLALGAIPA